jgi:hypothetical protein
VLIKVSEKLKQESKQCAKGSGSSFVGHHFDLTPVDETVVYINESLITFAGIATGIRQNEIKS